MDVFDFAAARFQTCQTLDGRREQVSVGKRNGRLMILLTPDWSEGGPERSLSFPWLNDPRYYVNLNEIERRTWRQVLSAFSISAIACQEGVSRQAIYARIEGKNGRGGMLAKNFYVLIWWLARQGQHGTR